MARLLVPLGIFLVLAGFLAVGLKLNPREVPSPLIDKPAPAFQLSVLHEPAAQFTPGDLAGRAWLLNVFASWCVSCREEHGFLMELARQKALPLIGLNYKDQRTDALGYLERLGNPYTLVVVDRDGRTGIDYGVYGTPETFLIDAQGIVRLKHVGPITPEVWQKKFMPKLAELKS